MIINVKVTPRSAKNEIITVSDNIFKIKVTVPPKKGKANEKVIELLSEHFKTAKSNVKIIAGLSFHDKLIEINR